MNVHMIARAIALVCVTSGVALATPAARDRCPTCIAPAADTLRGALLMDDRIADHWIAMGDALSSAHRYREAVAAYQRSIQLDQRVTRESTQRVARAYALMGNDKQAVRWLEQSLRAGATPAELWGDELFERYRGEARLRRMVEEKVDVRVPALRSRKVITA